MKENHIIIGIDPGTNILGYGIINTQEKSPCLIAAGVVQLSKYKDHFVKLKQIFQRVVSLLEQYKPDEMAVEATFYGKNIQSMLKLGRAQGAAITAGLSRDIPIFEYAPRKIKSAITGNGNASKEQVAGMLQKILNFEEMPKNLDATDGLAAAVCHFFQKGRITSDTKYANWNDFIKSNPERLGK